MNRRSARFSLSAAVALSATLACAPRPAAVTAITIVANPAPFPSIETAAHAEARVNWWDENTSDDEACTRCFAATELARFLPRAFGLPASAVRLSATLPDTGDVVVLGYPSSNEVAELLHRGEIRASLVQAVQRPHGRAIVIAGPRRTDFLYGAYSLLETLGIHFVGLGDTGTVVPSRARPWPAALALEGGPAFFTRGFWAWEPRGNPEFFLWMARNRLNQWTAADTAYVPLMQKLGFQLTGGGHTIESEFLPPSRYFGRHPEWYGLHGGRRSPAIHGESGDNFCTWNAAARRTLASNVVQALIDGSLAHVDDLQLWMLDGGRWCECDSCRAQGSPTDRWLVVAGEVRGAVDSARAAGRLTRSVDVVAPAYLETIRPPSHWTGAAVDVTFYPYFRCDAHALADSSCTEINRRLAAAYRGWQAAGHAPDGVCEYWNVGAFKTLPLVFPHEMAADLAWYADQHVGTIEYMHAPTRLWGCWTLNQRLFAQLAWDPRQSADTLVARFCREYFPASAEAMREHYRALERASANILALEHCAGVFGTNAAGGRLAQPGARLFPLAHLQPFPTQLSHDQAPSLEEIEAAMRSARAALDRARGLARDPIERSRLDEEERRFAYGEAMFRFDIGLIRTSMGARMGDEKAARAAFAAADSAARVLRGITDLVQVSASHANARDGLEASGVTATYELFRKRYGN
jgi:hypothetical protein